MPDNTAMARFPGLLDNDVDPILHVTKLMAIYHSDANEVNGHHRYKLQNISIALFPECELSTASFAMHHAEKRSVLLKTFGNASRVARTCETAFSPRCLAPVIILLA